MRTTQEDIQASIDRIVLMDQKVSELKMAVAGIETECKNLSIAKSNALVSELGAAKYSKIHAKLFKREYSAIELRYSLELAKADFFNAQRALIDLKLKIYIESLNEQ